MKIYDFVGAPNPKKLRVYLVEKGLDIPFEPVNIVTGENRTPEFLKKNPLGGLPVLELDDGRHLTESLAIIEYLEELHPSPPMIGTTPLERARVRELERIVELGVLNSVYARTPQTAIVLTLMEGAAYLVFAFAGIQFQTHLFGRMRHGAGQHRFG